MKEVFFWTIPGDDTNFRPSEQSITVEQKIFQGGQGIATFGKKKQHSSKVVIYLWQKSNRKTTIPGRKRHLF